MKVIDLLNKIANGEEVPKKIQVYSDIFVLDYGNKVYEHEKTRTNLSSIYNGNILNYEVKTKKDKPFNERVEEIYNRHIDYIYGKEDKEIEKLEQRTDTGLIGTDSVDMIEHTNRINRQAGYLSEIVSKINEIIDFINGSDKE